MVNLILPAPARYFPLDKGIYEVAPGLNPLGRDFGNGKLDSALFQITSRFDTFRRNKLAEHPELFVWTEAPGGAGEPIARHQCAPTHWAAERKIGKSFFEIHDPLEWNGRAWNSDRRPSPFLLRVERQFTWGIPEVGAGLFGIQVFFIEGCDIRQQPRERNLFFSAIETMSPRSQAYKSIGRSRDSLLNWLRSGPAES